MERQYIPNEGARLCALAKYEILDTPSEQAYDDITQLAATVAQMPVALISLVDQDRLWFKSRQGLAARQMPREGTFCAMAIEEPEQTLWVPDTHLDACFSASELVTAEPRIRSYLGVPLVTPDHHALGTLCVMDYQPRALESAAVEGLEALARQTVTLLELQRCTRHLRKVAHERESYLAQLESANKETEIAGAVDKLTRINSRSAFDREVENAIYRAVRFDLPLSLLMLDVDQLSQLNDDYGDAAGDAVLQEVARLLQRAIRPSDYLARYGGEEFVILLPNTPESGAKALAERLRKAIREAALAQRAVSVSIGAAALAPGNVDSMTLIAAADAALYRAKETRQNQAARRDLVRY